MPVYPGALLKTPIPPTLTLNRARSARVPVPPYLFDAPVFLVCGCKVDDLFESVEEIGV